MPIPTQVSLAHHFTSLINSPVTFTRVLKETESKKSQIYGIYKSLPEEHYTVVQAELPLLGSFAGALVGLRDADVRSRLSGPVIDDIMRDAITEVFNVASAAVATQGRTVFVNYVSDLSSLAPEITAFIQKPPKKLTFDVTIPNYQGGRFSLLFQ